jgi:aspartate racemase
MKKIGLIGGMSWESSALYYSLINEFVKERLGGLHSARCIMASVDFAEIERMQTAGDWALAADTLAAEARSLEAAGADLIVLCTNTMHKVADPIQAAVTIPLLHIGDVTAEAVTAVGLTTIGLLGTRFTMQESFYTKTMARHGLTVLVPTAEEQAEVNRIIYDELVLGEIRDESRDIYKTVMTNLAYQGAQGVILGCTEIELLISDDDSALPLFPTTRIHAAAAVEAALASN